MEKTSSNSDRLNDEQQDQLLMMMLIQQYQQIAMMGLGKLKNPGTDRVERDLSSARYAIDTLNALQRYTNGNLTGELKDYLVQTLTNLRLNYADEKKRGDGPADSGSEQGAAGQQEPPEGDGGSGSGS